jgi:hypothetical protein
MFIRSLLAIAVIAGLFTGFAAEAAGADGTRGNGLTAQIDGFASDGGLGTTRRDGFASEGGLGTTR